LEDKPAVDFMKNLTGGQIQGTSPTKARDTRKPVALDDSEEEPVIHSSKSIEPVP